MRDDIEVRSAVLLWNLVSAFYPKENPGSTSGYQCVPMSPVLYPLFWNTSANVVSFVGNPDACARKMKTGNRSSDAIPAGRDKRSDFNHSSFIGIIFIFLKFSFSCDLIKDKPLSYPCLCLSGIFVIVQRFQLLGSIHA